MVASRKRCTADLRVAEGHGSPNESRGPDAARAFVGRGGRSHRGARRDVATHGMRASGVWKNARASRDKRLSPFTPA